MSVHTDKAAVNEQLYNLARSLVVDVVRTARLAVLQGDDNYSAIIRSVQDTLAEVINLARGTK